MEIVVQGASLRRREESIKVPLMRRLMLALFILMLSMAPVFQASGSAVPVMGGGSGGMDGDVMAQGMSHAMDHAMGMEDCPEMAADSSACADGDCMDMERCQMACAAGLFAAISVSAAPGLVSPAVACALFGDETLPRGCSPLPVAPPPRI